MADIRVLALTHLLAAGAGFLLAPRELLETEVRHNGFFETDAKRVLAAAVESLRSENKLLVYSYKGSAAVSAERDGLLFLDARQDLLVPASVSFLLDLSKLGAKNVAYDEATRLVTVRLPPLQLSDIAFEPEGARTINGGLLTFSQAEVDELSRHNFRAARRAFIKQAQGPTLVQAAKGAAIESIQTAFEVPLRVAGRSDVQVVATFEGQ